MGLVSILITVSYAITYNMPDYFGIESWYSLFNNISISYIAALIFYVLQVYKEAAILAPFKERAEKGELVEISEIAKAYQAAVDHPVSNGQIYFVLHRHGWRKVMPRSKHPKKASEEEIAASKKLTPK